MYALNDTRSLFIIMYELCLFAAVCSSYDKLGLFAFCNLFFDILIHITVCMPCDRDRLFPVTNTGRDAFNDDRSTEYRSVKDGSYRTVRALVHLGKIVFLYSCGIWSDGRTFYRNTVFKSSVRRIDSHLIIGLITLLKTKVIILRLQIDKRGEQFIFDHLPQDTRHLISVHLNERSCHLDLFHVM